MDKQQKLKIALPILFVVMVFVWGPIILGTNSKSDPDNDDTDSNIVSVQSGSGIDLSGLAYGNVHRKVRTTYEDWGPNPFMLKRAPRALYIEGIMWDANNPQAIISGEMLGVGGVIDSKTVIEIKPNSVILQSEDGKTQTINQ